MILLLKNHWRIKDEIALYFCLLYKSGQYFCMCLFVLWICVGLHVWEKGEVRESVLKYIFPIKYNTHKLEKPFKNKNKEDDKQTHQTNENCSKQAIQYSTYGFFFLQRSLKNIATVDKIMNTSFSELILCNSTVLPIFPLGITSI